MVVSSSLSWGRKQKAGWSETKTRASAELLWPSQFCCILSNCFLLFLIYPLSTCCWEITCPTNLQNCDDWLKLKSIPASFVKGKKKWKEENEGKWFKKKEARQQSEFCLCGQGVKGRQWNKWVKLSDFQWAFSRTQKYPVSICLEYTQRNLPSMARGVHMAGMWWHLESDVVILDCNYLWAQSVTKPSAKNPPPSSTRLCSRNPANTTTYSVFRANTAAFLCQRRVFCSLEW